jgi:integrase
MKMGVEHRVPLVRRAVELLEDVRAECGAEGYVFPGPTKGTPLSTGALERVLDRMKLSHFTVHGFRSSFRDWVGEATSFSSDLAEMSLAHLVGGDVERAYRRGDMLDRRRKLMEAWAAYCDDKPPVPPPD